MYLIFICSEFISVCTVWSNIIGILFIMIAVWLSFCIALILLRIAFWVPDLWNDECVRNVRKWDPDMKPLKNLKESSSKKISMARHFHLKSYN